MTAFSSLRAAARRIKHDGLTVYFAARDPRTPILVRLFALVVAAYAMSPLDLIPDFIPLLGYLDDVILLPLGIFIIIKLTPPEVIESSRQKADELTSRPISNIAAIIIVGIWVTCALALGYWVIST